MSTDEIMAALAAVDVEELSALLFRSDLAQLEPVHFDEEDREAGDTFNVEADGIWLASVPSFNEFPCVEEEQQGDVERRALALTHLICEMLNHAPQMLSLLREIPQMVEVVKAAEALVQIHVEWEERENAGEATKELDADVNATFERLRAALGRIK